MERAKARFAHLGFQVVTGARYLGGHVGTEESKLEWVREKINIWTAAVRSLAKVARSSPHCAFVGLVKSLQSEWIHLQRVLDGIVDEFGPIEQALSATFLPSLLEASPDQPASLRALMALPIKFGGAGLPNPTVTADRHHTTSSSCTSVLSEAILRNTAEWTYMDHSRMMTEGKTTARNANTVLHQEELDGLMAPMSPRMKRSTTRSQSTGAWLSVIPSNINGLSLSKLEFRDGVKLRFGLDFSDLPKKCDGCNSNFSKMHALQCKKGGLVVGRHDEIRDELHYLATLATNSGSVRDEPIINIGRDTQVGPPGHARTSSTNPLPPPEETPPNPPSADRGDLLIRSFFSRQTDCVLDVRCTDSDAPSTLGTDPMRHLKTHETLKKKKYLERCLEQRRHFAPYVVDCYGLLGMEARAVNKKLATKLATKWKTAYSVTCGFINARVSIAILRATHRCLRGSRVPFRHNSSKWAQWDDGAGLALG